MLSADATHEDPQTKVDLRMSAITGLVMITYLAMHSRRNDISPQYLDQFLLNAGQLGEVVIVFRREENER